MRIDDTPLDGVRLIKPDVYEDFRGTNFESYNDTKYRDEISYPFVVDSISHHVNILSVVFMVIVKRPNL